MMQGWGWCEVKGDGWVLLTDAEAEIEKAKENEYQRGFHRGNDEAKERLGGRVDKARADERERIVRELGDIMRKTPNLTGWGLLSDWKKWNRSAPSPKPLPDGYTEAISAPTWPPISKLEKLAYGAEQYEKTDAINALVDAVVELQKCRK